MDDLTTGYFSYVGNIGGTSTPPTADTTALGVDRPIFSWPAGYAIAPGATISFTFVVRVAGLPTAAQGADEHDSTRRGPRCPIGTLRSTRPARSVPTAARHGMRNGALPNAGDTLNDYEAGRTPSVTVPALTLTKTDRNPALAPEIGAHKPFQIVVNLPEGVTENL